MTKTDWIWFWIAVGLILLSVLLAPVGAKAHGTHLDRTGSIIWTRHGNSPGHLFYGIGDPTDRYHMTDRMRIQYYIEVVWAKDAAGDIQLHLINKWDGFGNHIWPSN
jgi:hypothetical protein